MQKIEKIILLVDQELFKLSKNAREKIKQNLRFVSGGNPDGQMFFMPQMIWQSLKLNNRKVSKNFLQKLCLMSAFFWASFIIYDDFWDKDEKAKEELLPLANIMSRHFTIFFNDFFKDDKHYYNFFKSSFEKLDSSNFFEITECRKLEKKKFKNFDFKFWPSVGHLFGPLLIMKKIGFSFKSQEVQGLIIFFKNYLIARQLNDDMHDIREDWQRGHLSLAVNQLLNDAKAEDLLSFKKRNAVFWTKSIDALCAQNIKLLNNCESELLKNGAIKDKSILIKLCKKLGNASYSAVKDRDACLKKIAEIISS